MGKLHHPCLVQSIHPIQGGFILFATVTSIEEVRILMQHLPADCFRHVVQLPLEGLVYVLFIMAVLFPWSNRLLFGSAIPIWHDFSVLLLNGRPLLESSIGSVLLSSLIFLRRSASPLEEPTYFLSDVFLLLVVSSAE